MMPTIDIKLRSFWRHGTVQVARHTRVVARVSQLNAFQRQRWTSCLDRRVAVRLYDPIQWSWRVACNTEEMNDVF